MTRTAILACMNSQGSSQRDMRAQVTPAVAQLRPYVAGPRLADIFGDMAPEQITLLHANECPDGPFPEVITAVSAALSGLNRYPDQDCAELRALLSAQLAVPPESLMFGNGSCELLKLLAEGFVEPGGHVVHPDPSFVMYGILATQRQARVSPVPLRNHCNDLEAMAAACTPSTRLGIVCNPNNPTGTYLAPAALRAFLEAVPEETLVVLDEAYGEFVTSPLWEDTSGWVERYPNLVVLRTFSKIYGLAGLRVGYGIAHPEVVQAVDRLRQPYNVGTVAQVAAAESLRHPGLVEARRRRTERERDRLSQALDRLGRRRTDSQANFVFLNIEGMSVPGEEVPRSLLSRGVMTRSGYFMGCPGWMRVTIGSVEENNTFLEVLGSLAS